MLSDFYRSKEWLLFRLNVINDRINEEGLTICEYCGKQILRSYDIIAHHITPLTERNVMDAMISLNPDNIQLVHHVCHNKIHNKLGTMQQEVYLVWGSPMSGKRTYVDSVRENGDLIVDIDSIWQCVSGRDRYVKPDRLKSNVFGVRDLLIDQVSKRVGKWKNTYVIGGYPLSGERERLIKKLGAREIYMDVSKEECLARLEKINDGRSVSEWKKYIDDWWTKFNPTINQYTPQVNKK